MTTAPLQNSVDADAALLIEEMVERFQAGEPDAEAFIAAHPEHADTLRRLLPAVRVMANLSRSADANNVDMTGCDALGALGDFELIREVGRGGMGVVYEAQQVSLRRRVALKVLPWAAAMDPKQLQRFKNEALAAASLKHEHIVSVYAVGCERGVHYYAMEFVEGQTLAHLISERAGLRERPENDPLAATGPYVEALTQPRSPDTAPIAALSTERSGLRGRKFHRLAAQLITDAADALEHAHALGIVHRDIKPANLLLDSAGKLYVSDFGLARFGPDAGLTMSGDLLGTLRYMAPEQALARHGLADHRVDVYGLGCTLYELLTSRPAVGGEDKADIVRRIAFEEPITLRKLDNVIPAELETITLKCLSKNPNERYATAGELADDLRRWLGDRAIKAKPPGVRERAAKWGRRHAVAVAWTAAVLFLATAGLAVTAVIVANKEAEMRDALNTATIQRQRALVNMRNAQDVLNRIYLQLAGKRTPEQLQLGKAERNSLTEADRRLLTEVLEFYEKFARDNTVEAEARYELAKAYFRVGEIRKKLGLQQWREVQEQSVSLLGSLIEEAPDEKQYRNTLAHHFRGMGRFGEALAIWEQLATDDPAHPRYRFEFALSNENVAEELESSGRTADVAEYRRKSIEFGEQAMRLAPDDADIHRAVGYIYVRRGKALWQQTKSMTKPERSEAFRQIEYWLRRACAIWEGLLKADPDSKQNLRAMACACGNLACVQWEQGSLDEAERLFRQSIDLMGRGAEWPVEPDYILAYANASSFFQKINRLPDAVELAGRAVAIAQQELAAAPGVEDNHRLLAISHMHLSEVQALNGELPEAQRSLERAIATLQDAIVAFPNETQVNDSMGTIPELLAISYANAGQFEKGESHYRKMLQTARKRDGEASLNAAQALAYLGLSLVKQQKYADAEPILRECLKIREQKEPDEWSTFNSKSQLGGSLLGQKKYAEAEPLLVSGYEEMKRREAKLPPLAKTRLTEAGQRLVDLYEATGDKVRAAEWRKKLSGTISAKPADTKKD